VVVSIFCVNNDSVQQIQIITGNMETMNFFIVFLHFFICGTKMKRKIAQVAGEAKPQASEQQKTKQDAPAQTSAAGGLTKSQKKRQRKKQRSQEVQQAAPPAPAPVTTQPTKQVESPSALNLH
jgi:hypothetical protein